MRLNSILMLPSKLPTAALPIAALPLSAMAVPATALPANAAPVALPAAERALAPQAHQIQVQAELCAMALVLVDGNKGTTGFKGSDSISRKRYTDGGSGVPPRGKPV